MLIHGTYAASGGECDPERFNRAIRSHHVTAAWIDLRNCDSGKIAEIAAAESRIEAVVTNSEVDKVVGTRRPGVQLVTFNERRESPGTGQDTDIWIHSYNGRTTELLASHL